MKLRDIRDKVGTEFYFWHDLRYQPGAPNPQHLHVITKPTEGCVCFQSVYFGEMFSFDDMKFGIAADDVILK